MKYSGIGIISALAILSLMYPAVSQVQSSTKIVVYFFHGQFRCYSCTRMEELLRKAVEGGFPNQLAEGKIKLQTVNIDLKENIHFLEKYPISNRVVVSETLNGREIRWKELKHTWDYLGDDAAFAKYIMDEIKKYQ